MKKRMAKLMSLVLASAMTVTSPYAAGLGSFVAVHAAETDHTDEPLLGADSKTTSGAAVKPVVSNAPESEPKNGADALTAQKGDGGINALSDASFDVSAEYAFDSSLEWDTNNGKENNIPLTTESVPASGTTLVLDVLLPDNGNEQLNYAGSLKVVGVLRTGDNWDWVQSESIPEMNASDWTEKETVSGNSYYKKTFRIPFTSELSKATGAVKHVTVQFAGYQCDYSGMIHIANAKLENTEGSGTPGDNTDAAGGKEWDFNDGIGGWAYADWNFDYAGNTTVSAENGMMKVNVDFSKNKESGWSQTGIHEWGEYELKGANQTTFDFYYDPAKLDGDFKFKQTIQYQNGDQTSDLAVTDTTADKDSAEDAANGLKKVQITLNYDAITQEKCCNVVLMIVGSNTSYSGDVYIDNLKISKGAPADDGLIDVILTGTDATGDVSVQNGQLTTYQKDGTTVQIPLTDTIYLVDKNADAATKALYSYLKATGESDSVIYGHQNDTWHHAGSVSESDTKDVTGSISGVIGIDALSLTGAEYSASRYNEEIGGETMPETIAGNVRAAAALTNQNIAQGAVITLSEHMPNFSVVTEREGYDPNTEPTYAKYDFSGYTPGTLTGDCINELLPGGKYHEKYNAYLDMIADFVSQVNGPVLFRPFHENTGSWFWWGAAFCQPATYKNVWKYTVEYLRDTKSVHNLLYVYGPGSEAATLDEYGERYPGDDYVDMVGFDMYNSNPGADNASVWFADFRKELKLVEDFAAAHGKLIAVTETGVAADDGKALLPKDNLHKEWYDVMLNAVSASKASYFLLWANFSADGSFYTPYVKSVAETEDGTVLHGHEMLQNFYDFYCDGRSIFAANQKDLITNIAGLINVTARPTTENATGYIISPISGRRMLEPANVRAKVNNLPEGGKVTVVLHGKDKDLTITAEKSDVYYEAAVTAEMLAELGEYVGTIDLCINDTVMDTIQTLFNVQPPVEDPYEIDGFENYLGVDSMLNNAWATNKATGNIITLSLNKDKDKLFDGEYSMKFEYDETADGWAGATISKEVDWSDCDALQFYTIPDGKNQKVVIQLTANDKIYEAYLNLYEEYAGKTTPLLVTIPFADFCDRDADGQPKGGLVNDCAKVTSFGLWVNAIADSPAVTDGRVSGTIYYDKITAVKSGLTKATFQDPSELNQDPGTDPNPGDDTNNGNTSTGGRPSSGGGYYPGSSYYPPSSYYPANNTNPADNTKPDDTKPDDNTKPDEAKPDDNAKPDDGSGQTPTAPATPNQTEQKAGDFIQSGNADYEVTAAGNGKKEVAYAGVSKSSQTVTIPASIQINGIAYTVTSISDYAFDGDKQLKKVVIPASVTKIGNYAFQNCKKLQSIDIPKNVKTIGKNAFSGCKSITSVTFKGNKVTTIGQKAFMNNTGLKKITLPASVKIIRKNAFNGCKNLKTVQIQSEKITTIGKNAFKGVSGSVIIKVPAGKKSAYNKLLKNSGYTGKIKNI